MEKLILKLTLIFLLFLSSTATLLKAQQPRFSLENFIGAKGDTLKYRFLTPDYDTLRKYPLVIFLHGSGERGNNNEAQLKWG